MYGDNALSLFVPFLFAEGHPTGRECWEKDEKGQIRPPEGKGKVRGGVIPLGWAGVVHWAFEEGLPFGKGWKPSSCYRTAWHWACYDKNATVVM